MGKFPIKIQICITLMVNLPIKSGFDSLLMVKFPIKNATPYYGF